MLTSLKTLIYRGIKHCQKSDFHRLYTLMFERQYDTFEVLQRQRNEDLRALLTEAWQWVPFYRKRLEIIRTEDGNGFSLPCWEDIPPLTRLDVLHYSDELLHQKSREREMFYSGTGGSTASPVFIGHDKYSRDWGQAAYFFINEWTGLSFGKPYFLLWASEHDLDPQRKSLTKQFLMGFLQGRRILDTAIVSPETHVEHINMINRQEDCDYMLGYANEIYALACYSLENNISITRPLKAIYATATMLTPAMRDTIEAVFGCKVFNRYGSREAGDIACECEHQRGMHINPMSLKMEVVDENNRSVPYGQEGKILLTSLHNYSMPLIRYDIGDMGIMQAPELCPCGREWETLVRLTGRTGEKIQLFDGTMFNGVFVEEAFDNIPHLKKYQVHQLAPGRLHIKIRASVPNYVETYQVELQRITTLLQRWTQCPLEISYEQTEIFDRSPTGKELTIISKMMSPLSIDAEDADELLLTR
jgi:phenylacetate-CoA ligase